MGIGAASTETKLPFCATISAEPVALELDEGAEPFGARNCGKPNGLLCKDSSMETGDETKTAGTACEESSQTTTAAGNSAGTGTGTGLREVAGADSAPPPKNMRGVVTSEAGCDEERNRDGDGDGEGSGGGAGI